MKTIVAIHGTEGEAWIQQLPRLMQRFAERWDLTVGSPFSLSYNYVASATRHVGGNALDDAVLKLGFPGTELNRELVALNCFRGEGSVRLIRADPIEGAMLLERVLPGVSLDRAEPDDEAAVAIAAETMRLLWRPLPQIHNIPPLADWFAGFARLRARFCGSSGPIPEPLLAHAEALAHDLIATSPEPMLLHGDLHHGNILTAGRARYLAIDPKGVVGDPAFEPSAFLLNPGPVSRETTMRRVDIFADALNLDRERIRAWGFARAVLSACWTIEDNGEDYADAITVAYQLDVN